ncbi:hypothetical protein SpCBS45565_g01163 [Spizellomyces sp. 'palustris']|nr:hypothetical protein SpCBS45565_g01163 [Spizellomyces sp. 'palustris']
MQTTRSSHQLATIPRILEQNVEETPNMTQGVTLDLWKEAVRRPPVKGESDEVVQAKWQYYQTHIRGSEALKTLEADDFHLLLSQLGIESGRTFSEKAEMILGDMESAGIPIESRMYEVWAEHADIVSLADAESFLSTVWWCGSPQLVSDNLFATLIRILGAQRKRDAALVLFKKAKASGRAGKKTYIETIKTACWTDAMNLACSLCDELEKERKTVIPEDLLASMIWICSRRNRRDPSAASQIFELAKFKKQAGIKVYTEMINTLCEAGMVDEAVELCKEMIVEKKIAPNTKICNTLLWGYLKCKEDEMAMDVLRRMTTADVALNSITYEGVIVALAKQRDVDGAIEVFRRMEESPGATPTTYTYNIILNILLKHGRMADVTQLLEKMPKRGLKADAITYRTLIQGLTVNGRADDALKVFHSMLQTDIAGDARTAVVVLKAFVAAGNLEDAIACLNQMKAGKWKINAWAVTVLIHAYLKRASYEDAFELLNTLGDGMQPDRVTYTCFIDAYASQGDMEGVSRMIRAMDSRQVKPDTPLYNALIDAHVQQGNKNEAFRLFRVMVDRELQPDVRTYTMLVKVCADSGAVEECVRLIEQMEVSRVWPNVMTYTCLILGLLKAGQGQRAAIWFDRMVKASTSQLTITTRPTNGDKETVVSHPSFTVDGQACSTALTGLVRLKDFDNYAKVLHSIHECGLHVDPSNYVFAIEALKELGRPRRAEMLYRRMLSDDIHDRAAVRRARSAVLAVVAKKYGEEGVESFLRRERSGWKHVPVDGIIKVGA